MGGGGQAAGGRERAIAHAAGVHGAKPQIRVGCCGWNYKHWRGIFYPRELGPGEWFGFYARRFDTVEINNTFYKLPEAQVFDGWRQQAPTGFLYAVKASRFLTHMKKLKDAAEPLANILGRARQLGRHLGPVLYQLPPGWRCNEERLAEFLALLPDDLRHVLEFRERSWYAPGILRMLAQRSVSLCVHDMPDSATGPMALGPAAYVRFHGAGGKYTGSYTEAELRPWAEWLAEQHGSGREVYAYFNNDIGGYAIGDALRLREMLARLV